MRARVRARVRVGVRVGVREAWDKVAGAGVGVEQA